MSADRRHTPKGKATEPVAGLVCVGAITGVRGLQGDVRIKAFTADPAAIGSYGPLLDETGERSFKVKVIGNAKGQLIARVKGVEDRDASEALKGQQLFLWRKDFPEPDEDEFYHADLVGLRAELVGGGPEGGSNALGTVRIVHDYGAGVSLEIAGGDYGVVMVPFTKDTVPVVKIGEGRLEVSAIPGLLDAPEPEDASVENEDAEGER